MVGDGTRQGGSWRFLILVVGVSSSIAPSLTAQGGTLGEVREAVREGSGDPSCSDPNEATNQLEAELDGLFDETFGKAIEAILYLPFLLPRDLAHDPGGDAGFARYPYRDGDRYWIPAHSETPADQRWSMLGRVEFGTDFDDLERFGLAFLVEHESRFGLDGSWSRWREDLGAAGTDELDLADLNLVYRFAHGERAAFRGGMGVNFLNDDVDHDLGVNFTYGVDFLPVRPLVASLEMDLGTLGDATLQHYRAAVGVVIERFELTAGADFVDVDGEDLRSYSIGLRSWF